MNAERDSGKDGDGLLIGDQPVAAQSDTLRLLGLLEHLHPETSHSLGFPRNQELGAEHLTPIVAAFLRCTLGMDPGDDLLEHIAPYERAVRQFFTALAQAPWTVATRVTSCDSEGILLGLATARRHLPGAPVYASDRAHHGVAAAAAALGAELVTVPSRSDGVMDPDALRRSVQKRTAERGAIVLATCGTATTGAVDDVAALREAASAAGAVHVHTDASYGGLVAACAPSAPNWSFPHGADSVSFSAHRVLGLPMPWGIFLSRRAIEVPDVTVCDQAHGVCLDPSGTGLSTLLVWAALRRLGRTGIRAHILRRLETAEYAVRQLVSTGVGPSRPPHSLTVTLRRPSQRLVDKWHLSCEGDTARIVCLGHVTATAIDELAEDLEAEQHALQALAVGPAA
ncbi:aminotransferase class V-fold PLP-dependent enzyme [Streptomyces sp. NPDC001514]